MKLLILKENLNHLYCFDECINAPLNKIQNIRRNVLLILHVFVYLTVLRFLLSMGLHATLRHLDLAPSHLSKL